MFENITASHVFAYLKSVKDPSIGFIVGFGCLYSPTETLVNFDITFFVTELVRSTSIQDVMFVCPFILCCCNLQAILHIYALEQLTCTLQSFALIRYCFRHDQPQNRTQVTRLYHENENRRP